MKIQSVLRIIIPIVGLKTLFAASMGLLNQTHGQPFVNTNPRGESVMIETHGLHSQNTISSIA